MELGGGRNCFWGGVGWLEKKGGILFVSLFCLSHNMVI